jgi:sugar phosphate isomerase/epimerase
LSAMLPWALRARAPASIPVGLELYSVREALQRDPAGTVRAVAQLGYECVEFYAPYFDWSESETKQMKKLMDDLGIHCFSTHNDVVSFQAENLERARDRNLILGSRYVVLSSSEPKSTLDAWKGLADSLNIIADKLESSSLRVG